MMIICIDAGHGGSDPGATLVSRKESNDVLKMALAVGKILTTQGVKVVYTRTIDKDITINERCNISNKNNADYFLSIHRNSSYTEAKGYEIWVHSKASRSTQSKAKKILNNIVSVDTRKGVNRGVKKGAVSYTDFGINRLSNAPSALLELGFISNPDDNGVFDKYFDKLAEAIAKGLCSAVGVSYKVNKNTSSKTETKKPSTTTSTKKPTTTPTKKSIDAIAKEVIAGKWGNGDARKKALTKAGYNYSEVQKRVNELL